MDAVSGWQRLALTVEQPPTCALVRHVKTAKALSETFAPTRLILADEVIH